MLFVSVKVALSERTEDAFEEFNYNVKHPDCNDNIHHK